MKRGLLFLVALCALGAATSFWWPSSSPPPPAAPLPSPTLAPFRPEPLAPHAESSPAIVAAPPAPAPKLNPKQRGSPLAAQLNASTSTPQQDVDTLHALLRQYLHHLRRRQGHPIGNDSDLARVLSGRNPMRLVVIPSGNPALSEDGRLRDRWGTPYFVHPKGNNSFEIRSAGPDHQLFTADDLVAKLQDAAEEELPDPGLANPPQPGREQVIEDGEHEER